MKRLTAVLKRKKAARNSRSRSRDRKKKRRKKSESTEESGQESEGDEAVKGSGSEQEAEVLGFRIIHIKTLSSSFFGFHLRFFFARGRRNTLVRSP